MSECNKNEDAERLAQLLTEQRKIQDELKKLLDAAGFDVKPPKVSMDTIAIMISEVDENDDPELFAKLNGLQSRLIDIRNECIGIVDCYFREENLGKILAGKFRGKVSRPGEANRELQYTELVNQFFIQVRSKMNEQFWQCGSAAHLRSYALKAISYRVLSYLKRKKKLESFYDFIAKGVSNRLDDDGISGDLKIIMEETKRWEDSDNEKLKLLAVIFGQRYLMEMTVTEIANDLPFSEPTVYRYLDEARKKMKEVLES